MAVVLDTSIVVALAIVGEPDHDAVREWILSEPAELVTTPLVLAEVDHVLQRRAGSAVAEAVLADFRNGAYRVEWWPRALADSLNVLRAERRLGIGIADASLVALAAHLRTSRIATLDQRHFRQLGFAGETFTLLPADL
ncbi:MAG TPA: PIN domain-containing protein [Solirubrobacterales bacterium]|nr:PIN domain-containing protein [Solirubrobacterales bacterium]